MLCPNCYGRGWLGKQRPIPTDIGPDERRLVRCEYPGCHHGYISCCDGLVANGDTATHFAGLTRPVPKNLEYKSQNQ